MESEYEVGIPKSVLRIAGGVVFIIAVAVILWAAPAAYRWLAIWFLLASVGIGLATAAILHFWHKFKPVKEEELHNKRPLGLD